MLRRGLLRSQRLLAVCCRAKSTPDDDNITANHFADRRRRRPAPARPFILLLFCPGYRLLSIAWAGLVGEATQHAYFDGSAELSASDRGLWVSSLESRGVTYALSLITCGLLIYTTLHVYGAPPPPLPSSLRGVLVAVMALLLLLHRAHPQSCNLFPGDGLIWTRVLLLIVRRLRRRVPAPAVHLAVGADRRRLLRRLAPPHGARARGARELLLVAAS